MSSVKDTETRDSRIGELLEYVRILIDTAEWSGILQSGHLPKGDFVFRYRIRLQSQILLALKQVSFPNFLPEMLPVVIPVEEIFCSILGGKSKPPSSWNFMSFSRALFNLLPVSAAHDKRKTDGFKTHSKCASVTDAGGRLCPTLSHFKTFFEADMARLG